MPIINLNPIKLHIQELVTNPSGKASSYGANRLKIKEDLNKRYNSLLYKYAGFDYKVYKVGHNYFVHFKIPSETYEKLYYDIILEFIPEDSDATKDKNIIRYWIKFFSNSPAMMFTYTYVCYHNKLIPKDIIKFCSKNALRESPSIRNPVEVYGYEKSVYFACLYIMSHNLYKKFELEKNLYKFKKDTWDNTIQTQEFKLKEYNKMKAQVKLDKRKAKAKKIDEINKKLLNNKKPSRKKSRKK